MQIVVNNCGTSLDVAVFRWSFEGANHSLSQKMKIVKGSLSQWLNRDDGAPVGSNLPKEEI